MVLGDVIDSKDFCVVTLFLSDGYENNNFFTFLYSVAMETKNSNLVAPISAKNPHNWPFSCLYFRKARLNTAQMPT